MSQEVEIPCVGYSVKADLYEASSEEVVLMLIGFTSNKAKYADFADVIVEETGSSVLVLDYSGHGESPFDIDDLTPAQNFLEVITTFDWLKQQYPDAKVTVIGTSYGGFMATQLTKYREFDRLVLRVPAIYPPNVFYDKIKTFESTQHFQNYRHNTENLHEHPLLKRASEFAGKTLVVTHELDTVCPPQETGAFTKAFSAETWEAKGFKHGFGESEVTEEQKQSYYHKITEWLK